MVATAMARLRLASPSGNSGLSSSSSTNTMLNAATFRLSFSMCLAWTQTMLSRSVSTLRSRGWSSSSPASHPMISDSKTGEWRQSPRARNPVPVAGDQGGLMSVNITDLMFLNNDSGLIRRGFI